MNHEYGMGETYRSPRHPVEEGHRANKLGQLTRQWRDKFGGPYTDTETPQTESSDGDQSPKASVQPAFDGKDFFKPPTRITACDYGPRRQ